MDPSGPAQPDLDTAYQMAGNPTDQNPKEKAQAYSNTASNTGSIIERRRNGDLPVPSGHEAEATPTSMAYGARNSRGDTDSGPPGASNTEGEQMRPPGEGDVYRRQFNKEGFGEQEDMASDLDKKKEDQADAREKIKRIRKESVDVGGAFGQSGAPIVPAT